MEEMKDELPVLKNGKVVDDLGKYMTELLGNFQKHLGYYSADTSIGQDEITVSGGHGGIGSISNVFGECKAEPYVGQRYVDMFKNKIISDLSGVPFNLNLKWSEPVEFNPKEPEMDNKVIGIEDVTKLDKQGNVIKNENFEYNLINKDGLTSVVSKEDFVNAGAMKAMNPEHVTIDTENKRIIAKFENFKSKK
jgi:hypothetical protein